jgi:hypothetical protein
MYGSLDNSKATSASFHTKASPIKGGGFTRNVGAAAFKVGKLAAASAGAFGKALVGRDDFTQKVAQQAKAKY